jgi:hypothetical protein
MTKSGSIVSGPAPLIIIVFSLVLMPTSSHEWSFPGLRRENTLMELTQNQGEYTHFRYRSDRIRAGSTRMRNTQAMPNRSSEHVRWEGSLAVRGVAQFGLQTRVLLAA